MASAGRQGSGVNAQLAGLVSEALEDNQGIFDIVARHGFILGNHANQFQSELTAATMEALAEELERSIAFHGEGPPA